MVVLKTSKELSDMKLSCKISAQALRLAGELIRPGVSTAYVDKMLHEFILLREQDRPSWAMAVFRQVPASPSTTR